MRIAIVLAGMVACMTGNALAVDQKAPKSAKPNAPASEKANPPKTSTYLNLNNPHRPGAIVPENMGKEFTVSQTKLGPVTGYFTPAKQDIDIFEGGLVKWLKTAKSEPFRDNKELADLLTKERSGYRAQYLGVISGGRKVLHANFFFPGAEKQFFENWLTNPVVVDDGGNRFFYVEYDVEKKEYLFIMINGEA